MLTRLSFNNPLNQWRIARDFIMGGSYKVREIKFCLLQNIVMWSKYTRALNDGTGDYCSPV